MNGPEADAVRASTPAPRASVYGTWRTCRNGAGPFTGCGINPMRVLGAVVWEKDFFSSHAGKRFWVYWVGPFAARRIPCPYFA